MAKCWWVCDMKTGSIGVAARLFGSGATKVTRVSISGWLAVVLVLGATACGGSSGDEPASVEVSPDPIVAGEEFELRIHGEARIGPDFMLKVVEDDGPTLRYRLASVNDSVPVSPVSGEVFPSRLSVEAVIAEGSTWSATLRMPDDMVGLEIELCAIPEPCGRFSVR